jgi:hypothetical protein
MMNGSPTTKLKRPTKKWLRRITPKRNEPKPRKKRTISILNIKEWIMHLSWPINKPPSSKPSKRYKWAKTSLNPGITHLTPFIIIMETPFTFVSFASLFSTWPNNSKDTQKNALCSIPLETRFTGTNNSRLLFLKLMV